MTEYKEEKKALPVGLYGITAEKFSAGRTNIQVVEQMIKGGIKIIQYREKRPAKSYQTILRGMPANPGTDPCSRGHLYR